MALSRSLRSAFELVLSPLGRELDIMASADVSASSSRAGRGVVGGGQGRVEGAPRSSAHMGLRALPDEYGECRHTGRDGTSNTGRVGPPRAPSLSHRKESLAKKCEFRAWASAAIASSQEDESWERTVKCLRGLHPTSTSSSGAMTRAIPRRGCLHGEP